MLRAIALAVAMLVALPPPAVASVIHSRSGASATVAAIAARALQCVISGLEAAGYPVKFIGGYRRHGSVRGSLHPAGMALDVNQVARNHTVPKMPSNEIAIANSCGAISGAQWANGDSGHFQVGGWVGNGRARRHGHRRHRR
jgi:hypothetical protein